MLRIDYSPSVSAYSQCCGDHGEPIVTGAKVRALLLQQFFGSLEVAAIYDGADLVAMIGVYDQAENSEGWFLPGRAIKRYPVAAAKAGREVISHFSRSYEPVLYLARTDSLQPAKLARLMGLKSTGKTGYLGHIPYEVFS